jgi:high-affinity K+ transport system ATPase subunit B
MGDGNSNPVGGANDPNLRFVAVEGLASRIDAIVVLYLILSFVGFAALLQVLGIYREEIRRFNSAVIRRSLQMVTYCFETKYFHLRPNEIMTRGHINMFELFVRTTIDFFYDAPNLITFTIGLLQVISTWDPDHPMEAKKINLIALCVNYIYTMVREISMYRTAFVFDASRNWRVYKLVSTDVSSPTNEQLLGTSFTPILSQDLSVGDMIRLDYGETFPAECKIVKSSTLHTLMNTKEESGEDCSWIFTKGDFAPYGSRVSTQGASVIAQVTATRNTISADGTHRRMERFPEHMNRYITVANLFALGLLSILAGLAVAYIVAFLPSREPQDSELPPTDINKLLFTHFFSIIAQLNMLIPSMRWVILYFLYVFLVDAAYPAVTIQSHAAVRKLESVDVVYMDKTGTLTDTKVEVERIELLTGLDELFALTASQISGITRNTLAAFIVMACNDTQPGNGEGTSPEEMVIAEYLRTHHFETWIERNPLKPENEILRLTVQGTAVSVTVKYRSNYIPSEFCRIAEVRIGNTELKVRQGGSDRMAAFTNDRRVMKAESAAARLNPNRAFGWTVSLNEKSFYCARATFTNPPRPSSADFVSFMQSSKIAVRMLTGDGLEAAKYIASAVGIHKSESAEILFLDYTSDSDFFDAVTAVTSHSGSATVLVEGSALMRLIQSDRMSLDFLQDRRINMVIYRTKSADKAVIVRHASESLGLGVMMVGDAANDKHVLALGSITSVSLRHGAAPCRVVSDIVVTEPGDLVDLWTSIQSLHLTGARALLMNTCLIGSVVSGLTLVGIYFNNFQLLAKGFLYPDPYDTRLMVAFSSLLYAPSACAAVMGGFSTWRGKGTIPVRSLRVLVLGLILGILVGLVGPKKKYSTWMLVTMILVAMGSHGLLAGQGSRFARARDGSARTIGILVDVGNTVLLRGLVVIVYSAVVISV